MSYAARAGLALAVSIAMSLTACSGDQEPNLMSGDGSFDEQTLDCGGRPTLIRATQAEYTLEGDCPEVSVEGSEVDLNLGGATVGSLTMLGDHNEIDDAASVAEVTVRGHDNEIDAVDIGQLLLAGDDNEVDARSEIQLVRVEGDENRVEADRLGESSEDGSDNMLDANS